MSKRKPIKRSPANRSPILGVYTSTFLGAKLEIKSANDINGAISGTFSLGKQSWEISGTWHTSSIAPRALLQFAGSGGKPVSMISGVGAMPKVNVFDELVMFLSISIGRADGEMNNLQGVFTRPD